LEEEEVGVKRERSEEEEVDWEGSVESEGDTDREVEQTGGAEQERAGGKREVDSSSSIPLVRVGSWDNVLVRSDLVTYPAEKRAAAAPCTDTPSRAERRGRENDECIGGLRSPWKAVRRIPGLSRVGGLLREVLEEELNKDPKLMEVVGLFG